MAINLFCGDCKVTSNLKAKKCGKCGKPFGRSTKYRVDIRSTDRVRITRVVSSLRRAREVEAELRSKAQNGKLERRAKAPALSETWKHYLRWAKLNKKSWETDQFLWDKHLAPRFQDRRMDRVRPIEVQALMDKMRIEGGYAPATVKHVFVLLRRVYNWSAEMRLYEGRNPTEGIKPPRLNNERTECLSKSEIKKLMATLDEWPNKRLALLIKFALLTGCRRGELLKLEWDDVGLDPLHIRLRNPKSGSDAVIPISEEAGGVLTAALEALPFPDCAYVFPTKTGAKRKCIRASWKRLLKKAGLPSNYRFHDLRHSFASHLASSGQVSLYTIQRLLNHKSPKMTQRYAHLLDETLRQGAHVMSNILK